VIARLGIPQPESVTAVTLPEALAVAKQIGYPLMVRPRIAWGQGMEIVYDEEMLTSFVNAAVDITPGRPILIDKFLEHAIEVEADAIADGETFLSLHHGAHRTGRYFIPGQRLRHPAQDAFPEHIRTINEYTRRIAADLRWWGS